MPCFAGCGNSGLVRHSELSEESLFDGNPRKEGFLTPQTPFGMTGWPFFRSLSSQARGTLVCGGLAPLLQMHALPANGISFPIRLLIADI